jgi:hypothetical protein
MSSLTRFLAEVSKVAEYNGVYVKHIWVYDDNVIFGPLSTVWVDDEQVEIWDEIMKLGMSLIISAKSSRITCKRQVWDAVAAWAKSNRYGGMGLADYVNRMLSQFPGSLREE